jgi:hypothetical protein
MKELVVWSKRRVMTVESFNDAFPNFVVRSDKSNVPIVWDYEPPVADKPQVKLW